MRDKREKESGLLGLCSRTMVCDNMETIGIRGKELVTLC